jgi:hypothetical protein
LNSCANKWKFHAQWTIFRKKFKMQIFQYFPPITAIRAFKSQKFDQKQFYRPQISRNRHPYCYSSEVLKKLLPVTCPQWGLVQIFYQIWIPWPQIILDWHFPLRTTLNLNWCRKNRLFVHCALGARTGPKDPSLVQVFGS